jgi:UPF0755 protein
VAFVKATAWLLGVVALLGLLGFAWLVVVYPNQAPATRVSRTVAIELGPHSSLDDATGQLEGARLLRQPRVFALYVRAMRAAHRLRPRRVLVTTQMTPRQLLQRIASGYGSTPVRITIPEGWNQFDIAARLDEWGVCTRAAFLEEAKTAQLGDFDPAAHSSEGYLFPDTYWLHDDMSAAQVVQRLTSNATRRMAGLLERHRSELALLHDEFGFGVQQWVILASIVEKEARIASEQPTIAGVFLNRLSDPQFRPKRLQADPTVAYGCLLHTLPSCADFDGKHVTHAMTVDPANPYNTYRIDGLPPTPIANAGLSALRAVLMPEKHAYLYFVARGDGRHTFSSTLSAHNAAVQQGQRAEPAAGF